MKKIIVTGNLGYIGTVMVRLLHEHGYRIVGIDSGLFERSVLGAAEMPDIQIWRDVRDVETKDFDGADAVIHLASLSNDPLGNIDPVLTDEINRGGTLRCAVKAKSAGVPKFIFSSSCSMYGAAADDGMLNEDAPFNPVTAYAVSKIAAEGELNGLADDEFCPVSLRNATAYGMSPRMRFDLVVNEFVASALATGEINILSDGTPWRPLVHVEDICHAALLVLTAPASEVRAQAFNVGSNSDNYRVHEIATMIATACGAKVKISGGSGADIRSYKVDCSKISRILGYRQKWNLQSGVEELYRFLSAWRGYWSDHRDPTFVRLLHLKALQQQNLVDNQLRLRR